MHRNHVCAGLAVTLLMVTQYSFANAGNKRGFRELLDAHQYKKAEMFLGEWKKASPGDVEVYIGYGNLYAGMARQEQMEISDGPAESGGLVISDTKTGRPGGSLSSTIHYDQKLVRKALVSMEEALKIRPDRLDVHMGILHLTKLIGDNDGFIKSLRRTLQFVSGNTGTLFLDNDKRLDDPPGVFMPEWMQEYITNYYKLGTEQGGDMVIKTATLVLEYYPENAEMLNDAAAIYGRREQWDQALPFFLGSSAKVVGDLGAF
jgi:tetratricopeptide (TPR) repeat protein